jgi:hypothetical protein
MMPCNFAGLFCSYSMGIKLNYWQTALLFLPFIAGFIIMDVPGSGFQGYQTHFAIANLLLLFNVCLVINYQTYLVLRFNNVIAAKSNLFTWNACIPALFITLYLFYVIVLTITKPAIHNNPKNIPGPMRTAQLHFTGWIILLFLIHSFVTFYFINKPFVSSEIKKMPDGDNKQQIIADFLTPINTLIKISIWVFVIGVVLTFVADVIRFS